MLNLLKCVSKRSSLTMRTPWILFGFVLAWIVYGCGGESFPNPDPGGLEAEATEVLYIQRTEWYLPFPLLPLGTWVRAILIPMNTMMGVVGVNLGLDMSTLHVFYTSEDNIRVYEIKITSATSLGGGQVRLSFLAPNDTGLNKIWVEKETVEGRQKSNVLGFITFAISETILPPSSDEE